MNDGRQVNSKAKQVKKLAFWCFAFLFFDCVDGTEIPMVFDLALSSTAAGSITDPGEGTFTYSNAELGTKR